MIDNSISGRVMRKSNSLNSITNKFVNFHKKELANISDEFMLNELLTLKPIFFFTFADVTFMQ